MRIIEAFEAQLCSCFFSTILMKEAIERYYCHASDLHVALRPKNIQSEARMGFVQGVTVLHLNGVF